jgi:membrane protein YdbS with pleckstrin-like domain
MQIQCPHCGALLNAPPQSAGEMATCSTCHGKFQIPAPKATVSEPASVKTAAAATAPPLGSAMTGARTSIPSAGANTLVETQVWTGSPSQWVGFAAYFWCVVLAVAFGVAAVLVHRYFWFGLLLPLVIACAKFFRIKSICYVLTSQRLKIITGLVDRKEVEIELFRLRDLSLEQSFLQRMVNVGTVEAASSDKDAPGVRLKWVNNPDAVKDQLRNYIMQARQATGTTDLDMTMTR